MTRMSERAQAPTPDGGKSTPPASPLEMAKNELDEGSVHEVLSSSDELEVKEEQADDPATALEEVMTEELKVTLWAPRDAWAYGTSNPTTMKNVAPLTKEGVESQRPWSPLGADYCEQGPHPCKECGFYRPTFFCPRCQEAPVCMECLPDEDLHNCTHRGFFPLLGKPLEDAEPADSGSWKIWAWNGDEAWPPAMCSSCWWPRPACVEDCPACLSWFGGPNPGPIPAVSEVYAYETELDRLQIQELIPESLRSALKASGFAGPEMLSELGKEPWYSMKMVYLELVPDAKIEDHWQDVVKLGTWWRQAAALADQIATVKATESHLDLSAKRSRTWLAAHEPVKAAPKRVVFAPPKLKVAIGRFPTRRRANLSRASGAESREAIEAVEKKRWLEFIMAVVVEAQLPVLTVVQGSADPQAVLARCTGGARAKTMRTRCRDWKSVRLWLHATHGLPWPAMLVHFVDYLCMRAGEPCAFSAINAAVAALDFMEKCGGILKGDRMSRSVLVQTAKKDIEVELRDGRGKARRRAPQVAVSLLVEWERQVLDESLVPYWRAFAFYKLCKFWMAMRYDDGLGLPTCGITHCWTGIEAEFLRTKVSGAGKRVEVVYGYICEDAYLVDRSWIGTGFQIWQSELFTVERSQFFALPNADYDGVISAFPDYCKVTPLTSWSVANMELNGWWLEKPGLPAPPRPTPVWLTSFYNNEHCDRATLPSWATALEFEPWQVNMIGRWKPEGSEDYIRTQRATVYKVQTAVAEAMRAYYAGKLDMRSAESGLKLRMEQFVSERFDTISEEDFNADIAMLFPDAAGMKKPVRGFLVKQDAKSAAFQKAKNKHVGMDLPSAPLVGQQPKDKYSSVLIKGPVDEETQYWASVSKNGKMRTLHYTGACPTVRGVDAHDWVWTTLEASKCAQACKRCFGEKGLGSAARLARKRQDDSEAPFECFEEPRVEDIQAILSSSESTSSDEPEFSSGPGTAASSHGTGAPLGHH